MKFMLEEPLSLSHFSEYIFVSAPSECNEGTSGLSDIPLPKKLRTSEDPADKDVGGEQDQEWCEVRLWAGP